MTDRELMQQALEALELATTPLARDRQEVLRVQAALRKRLAQPEQQNQFNPDWDAMAVMVEEQQRMAKRIAELEAQPEQEPVANIRTWHKNGEQHAELWNWDKGIETLPDGDHDLYTTPPPQRKPLTDEEIEVLAKKHNGIYYDCDITFARAIEAAHGIKGEA